MAVSGTSAPMIQLIDVTKRFADDAPPAVEHLEVSIERGEIVMLIGPSGCGKTTTLRMINRLIEPTEGRIHLDGEDVTTIDPVLLRRRIGYVIQQVGLFPHLSVADNIATVPRLLGWDRARIAERITAMLDLVRLDGGYAHRYPRELSGGQRQRVGVARALAADPPVLLMDEPFGAIDPITRTELQDEFLRLQKELSKTIVFVTHDLDEAVRLGDRIALLGPGGHLVQFATPGQLLGSPINDFVESFVGRDRGLRRLEVTRISTDHLVDLPTDFVPNGAAPTLTVDLSTLKEALSALMLTDAGWLPVGDADGNIVGTLTADAVHRAARDIAV